MKNVFIITVNWNRADDTRAFLESFSKLNVPADCQFRFVVVDNGSTEAMPRYKDITVLRNEKNLGFAGGNNVGIKWALENKVDYLLLINNDTLMEDPNLVVKLLKKVQKPSVGLVTSKIHFAPGFEYHADRYSKNEIGKVIWYAGGSFDWQNIGGIHRGVDEVDHGQYDKIEEVDFASGCCFFLPRSTVENIGFFKEEYFSYLEDADYCLRINKAGLKIIYNGLTSFYHQVARSSGIGSNLNDYYITRNRLIFGFRHASFKTKFNLIQQAIGFLFNGREYQKKGVRDYFLGKWGKGGEIK